METSTSCRHQAWQYLGRLPTGPAIQRKRIAHLHQMVVNTVGIIMGGLAPRVIDSAAVARIKKMRGIEIEIGNFL